MHSRDVLQCVRCMLLMCLTHGKHVIIICDPLQTYEQEVHSGGTPTILCVFVCLSVYIYTVGVNISTDRPCECNLQTKVYPQKMSQTHLLENHPLPPLEAKKKGPQ